MKDIVFDLGGVLIDWNPRYLYRKIFATEAETEWFLTHICTSQWNTQQDAGRSFEEGIELLSKKYPEYAFAINFYYTRWNEMLGSEISGSVQILRELKARGHRVYALTNWSAQTFPIARKKYKFLEEFDGMVVSGEEKLVKPDPVIYSRLLERYQLRAPNCVFIDDNSANISKAADLGFETVLFTTPEDLRRILTSRGLL
ncbi:MAG: HAD family phosphatase [Elusimicrobiaceae bacterium]|nr:HAD family phosphatase [Elusimicrobiaceae bacterium]